MPPALPRLGPTYTVEVVQSLARCTGAITALNARISISPVAKPWQVRASWSGYATALQLQGVEVDEIDIFSRACGIKLPHRPMMSTTLDPLERFAEWQRELAQADGPGWRELLPTAVGEAGGAREHPPLVRAVELVRQHARLDATSTPWLWAPIMLRGVGLTASPLPCLTGGVKALWLKRTPADVDWAIAFNRLSRAAEIGLERLDDLERLHRQGLKALLNAYRAGALPRLLALSLVRPLLSPQGVADALNLSVAGASKLLERAVEAGLLVEITDRRTWRQFLTADLAVQFGFAGPRRGRPSHPPPALPASREMSHVLGKFDREMADIDRLLERINRGDRAASASPLE